MCMCVYIYGVVRTGLFHPDQLLPAALPSSAAAPALNFGPRPPPRFGGARIVDSVYLEFGGAPRRQRRCLESIFRGEMRAPCPWGGRGDLERQGGGTD